MPTPSEQIIKNLEQLAQHQAEATAELKHMQAKYPKKHKKPSTIQEDGMNQFQAAIELRTIIRRMEIAPTGQLNGGLVQLRHVLELPRSRKDDRLQAFRYLEAHVNEHLNAEAENAKKLRHFVQHIPTAPNLPQTNAENVLRAMVAILKTNGLVTG